MKNLFLTTSALAFLMACGGSGSSGDGTVIHDLSFDELRDLGEGLNVNVAETSDDALPVEGTFDYEGYAIVAETYDSDYSVNYAAIGQSTLTVDFEDGALVSGTASNFYEVDVEILNDEAGDDEAYADDDADDDLAGESIVGSFSYNAEDDSIQGTLTKLSGVVTDYEMDTGDFELSGENGEYLETESGGMIIDENDVQGIVAFTTFGKRDTDD